MSKIDENINKLCDDINNNIDFDENELFNYVNKINIFNVFHYYHGNVTLNDIYCLNNFKHDFQKDIKLENIDTDIIADISSLNNANLNCT